LRILLTGATGFVGPLLGEAILRTFPDVQLLAVGGRSLPSIAGSTATLSPLDSIAEAERLVQFRPDVVVHLAALSSVAAADANGPAIMGFNLGGTMRLARALRGTSQKPAFIFASSGEVYGSSFTNGVVDEDTPLRPGNAYARSKAAAEYALTDLMGDCGPVILLRLFNHTGPGQDERFVVPSFAAQIARIEKGQQTAGVRVGNLAAERDFLDVADVVDAYIAVIRAAGSMPTGPSVFNVCSSSAVSIQSILDGLISLSRANIQVSTDPGRMRASDIPKTLASSERFRKRFGWTPKSSIQASLPNVLNYWRGKVADGH